VRFTAGQFTTRQEVNVSAPTGVAADQSSTGAANGYFSYYTPGVTRIAPLASHPNVVTRWKIYGFSMQALMAIIATNTGTCYTFGRFGPVWAGLYLTTPPQDFGLPALPPDLSTFTHLWDGESGLRYVSGTSFVPPDADCTLQAATYMFPMPIDAAQNSQLAMGLVLNPSLVASNRLVNGLIGAMPFLWVKSCTYSLLYDEVRPDGGLVGV
jgi:hypothetical protein